MKKPFLFFLIILFSGCSEKHPIAEFELYQQECYVGETVIASNLSKDAYSYKWFVADEEVSTNKNYSITPNQTGLLTIKLIVYSNNNTYSDTTTRKLRVIKRTGDVTFWYDSSGSKATVTIAGETGDINSFYSSSIPECGAAGCANFTLPIGTYNYSAKSVWHTWSAMVTIEQNKCAKIVLR